MIAFLAWFLIGFVPAFLILIWTAVKAQLATNAEQVDWGAAIRKAAAVGASVGLAFALLQMLAGILPT